MDITSMLLFCETDYLQLLFQNLIDFHPDQSLACQTNQTNSVLMTPIVDYQINHLFFKEDTRFNFKRVYDTLHFGIAMKFKQGRQTIKIKGFNQNVGTTKPSILEQYRKTEQQ